METRVRSLTAQVEAYQTHIEQLEKTQLIPEKEQGMQEEIVALRNSLNASVEECVVNTSHRT